MFFFNFTVVWFISQVGIFLDPDALFWFPFDDSLGHFLFFVGPHGDVCI